MSYSDSPSRHHGWCKNRVSDAMYMDGTLHFLFWLTIYWVLTFVSCSNWCCISEIVSSLTLLKKHMMSYSDSPSRYHGWCKNRVSDALFYLWDVWSFYIICCLFFLQVWMQFKNIGRCVSGSPKVVYFWRIWHGIYIESGERNLGWKTLNSLQLYSNNNYRDKELWLC